MRAQPETYVVEPTRPAWKPLFLADWDDVTFAHFAFDPSDLQPHVPFPLDLFDGRAYVSLVAFTQRNLRPALGGRLAAAFSLPLATHAFLNVRTYVRHAGEPGIYFLAEWIPNRLATWIGPPLYGLPYRLGKLTYRHDRARGFAGHQVIARDQQIAFDAHADLSLSPTTTEPGSRDAFLLERYAAFTRYRGRSACFRVRHAPWMQRPARIELRESDLLSEVRLRWDRATLVGGSVSDGLKRVGLSAPTRATSNTTAPPLL